jgi:hypothetical protein
MLLCAYGSAEIGGQIGAGHRTPAGPALGVDLRAAFANWRQLSVVDGIELENRVSAAYRSKLYFRMQ